MTDIEQIKIIEVAHSAPEAHELAEQIGNLMALGWKLLSPPTTVALPGRKHPITTIFVLGKGRDLKSDEIPF